MLRARPSRVLRPSDSIQMSLKTFARRGPAAWFAALVIAGACTAGVDKLTGPSTFELGDASRNLGTTSATGMVISQVYGGGGNNGSTYKNDFIELYNGGSAAVDLSTWSVQYASATGTFSGKTNLVGILAPGHYYLVQEAVGAGGTTSLPTPDATGTISMAAGAGKVALVSSQTALAAACSTTDPTVIDYVGYGTGGSGANCSEGNAPAPTLTSSTSASRNSTNADTQNNAADFTAGPVNPRNSGPGGIITTIPLEKVTITSSVPSVTAGTTVQFIAVGQNAAGTTASNVTITWASDNVAATVDNTGKVTGVTPTTSLVTLTATATTGAGATLVTKTATTQITVTAPIPPTPILISQAYGGGGNTGATLQNDFIELFNPTSQPVALAGWSVQYGSASTGVWTVTPLTGTIQPGGYFLIQESKGGAGTDTLPTPDVTGTLLVGGPAGRVALVRSTVALPNGCPASTAPVQDIVAWATTCYEGSAAVGAPTSAQSVQRKGEGSIDTDDNAADFDIDLAAPRNSATDRLPVAGALDHVVISGGATSVAAGTTTQFTTSSLDAAGVTVGSAKVTWSSSDPATASIDNTGKVTAKVANATPVTLTATSTAGGVSTTATTSITVTTAAPVASVTMTPDAWTLTTATTKALVATALDAAGKPTAGTFTWVSSDPTVATVDANGVVTGIKAGTTNITATADGKTATTVITVVAGNSTVTVTNGKTSLALGMQTQFFFGGAPSVTWSTTNPAIITVDQKGVMTAKGIGSAQLIATAPDFSATQVAIKTYLAAGTTGLRLGHNEEFGTPQAPVNPNNFIIRRDQYTVSYNASIGGANWVSWNLDKTHVGTNGRCPGTCYSADTALTNAGITAYTTADWVSGNTYDRGHMAPSADWTSSEADNNTTFFLTNFLPQTHDMNAGPWERLENALRDSVSGGREAYIIAGGIFKDGVGLGTISNLGKIRIPNSTWKIVVITPAGAGLNVDGTLPPNTSVLAVDMPNSTGIIGDPFEKYLTTVDRIQQATGYDFLALLRDDVECRVEVRNCAPTGTAITGDGVAGGVEGQTLTFNGAATDPDAGDVVSYAWSVNGQPAGTQPSLSYTFANNGAYVVRLIASDGKGGVDSAKTTVTITNVAPSVSGVTGASVDAGVTWTSAGAFTDPGADSWTAVADYGDGSAPETIALGADKTFALSHAFLTQGGHTVTVTVTDSDGASGTETVTVVVRNTAPVVAPIVGATIDEGSAYTAAGSFSDFGIDTWTATVDYGDGTGSQSLALSGTSFSLAHTYATHGTYVVTVRVMDSGSAVGSAQATVTVNDVAPVVAAIAPATVDEGTTYSASGSFSDVGIDSWTATVNYGDGTGTQPLALSGTAFTLSHRYAAAGSFSVTVTVVDGGNASGTSSGTVTVRNLAPVIAAIASTTINEGGTYSATSSFADASAGAFSATVDYGDGSPAQSLVLSGSTFALNHQYSNDGSYMISVRVTDAGGATGAGTATVTVANVAPVVTAPAPRTIPEGSHYTATATFTDPGADSWSATVDYGDGSPIETVAVSGTTVALDHVYARDNTYTVTVTVSDGVASTPATGTVVVTNVTPVISALPNATILRGETYSAAGSFADPGADSWTATVNYGDGSVSALALDGKSFALSHTYSTIGVNTVTVGVNDGSATGTQTARVTVLTTGQSIAELIRQVSALVANSKLRPMESKWILNKLDIAAKQAEKGNIQPTRNQLQEILAFIEAARRTSVISAADAASLTAYTQRILASLQ